MLHGMILQRQYLGSPPGFAFGQAHSDTDHGRHWFCDSGYASRRVLHACAGYGYIFRASNGAVGDRA